MTRVSRMLASSLAVLFAAGAYAEEAAVVASGQRPFQVAARSALRTLGPAGTSLDAGQLRKDPKGLADASVIVSIGPLASGMVARALPPEGRVVAVLTPRTMGLPPTRTLLIPLDPSPDDVFSVIKDVLPETRRVGVLTGQSGPSRATLQADGRRHGIDVVVADDDANVTRSLDELLPVVEVLWVDRSARITADREAMTLLFTRAEDAAVPVVGAKKTHVLQGATFAVVPDPAQQGEVAGEVARRLLAGEVVRRVAAPRGAVLWNSVAAERHGAKLTRGVERRARVVR